MWSMAALAAEAAEAHIANNADVLTGTAQMVVGAVGVAKTEGVLWFGTQANQTSLAPEIVVASQVYHWEHMLEEMVGKVKDGTLGGELYAITFANDGLVIEYNEGFDLPEWWVRGFEARVERDDGENPHSLLVLDIQIGRKAGFMIASFSAALAYCLAALALESAEAAAEWIHRKIRSEWGFPDGEEITTAGERGELLVSGLGLAMIARYVPARMGGFMMGAYFVASGVSQYLGGLGAARLVVIEGFRV